MFSYDYTQIQSNADAHNVKELEPVSLCRDQQLYHCLVPWCCRSPVEAVFSQVVTKSAA